jgi:hypothetical protein
MVTASTGGRAGGLDAWELGRVVLVAAAVIYAGI